jgi:hypothetical protein
MAVERSGPAMTRPTITAQTTMKGMSPRRSESNSGAFLTASEAVHTTMAILAISDG